jgi:GT2 family glycosyltransferase
MEKTQTERNMNQQDLSVIIVNYRTPALTIRCLETLAEERSSVVGMSVILVDNGSQDDSVSKFTETITQRGWGEWVELIASPKNLGFAGGNNLGIRSVLAVAQQPRYVLLLNSDTEVHSGCLSGCQRYLDARPEVGAMSCLLLNADGSPQNTARKYPRPDREIMRAFGLPWIMPRQFGWADIDDLGWDRRSDEREVEWLGGAFLMVPTRVLRELGGLDEDFFFYGEDVEFSHRVAHAGYKVIHWPGASITHLGGASSNSEQVPGRWREQHEWRGRLLVQRKCYGRVAEILIHAAYLLAATVRKSNVLRRGQRGQVEDQRASQSLSILTAPFREAVQ